MRISSGFRDFGLPAVRAALVSTSILGIALASRAQSATPQASLTMDSAQANANAPLTLTLQDALERARKNDPQFQAAVTAAKLAHEDRVQARAALLPSVGATTQALLTPGNGSTPNGRFATNAGGARGPGPAALTGRMLAGVVARGRGGRPGRARAGRSARAALGPLGRPRCQRRRPRRQAARPDERPADKRARRAIRLRGGAGAARRSRRHLLRFRRRRPDPRAARSRRIRLRPDLPFEPLGRTFAELTVEQKNLYSHRARAFRKVVAFLRKREAGLLL